MNNDYDSASTDRLLAALYGDDDGSVSPGVSADIESMRELRSMVSSLPELEPPSHINPQLIAAAAAAVKPAKQRESMWELVRGWLAPLVPRVRAHPALAAMASLVLVASIGGVLYVNGKGDLAEPTQESASSPQKTPAAAAATPVATGESRRANSLEAADEATDEAGDPSDKPAFERSSIGDARTQDNRNAQAAKAAKAAKPRPERKPSPKPSGVKADSSSTINLPLLKEEEVAGKLGGTGSGAEPGAEGRVQQDADDRVNDRAKDKAPATDPARSPKEAPPPPKNRSRLKDLLTKGRQFSKAGDCASVLRTGATVRDLDNSYYQKAYRADPQIATCYRVSK